MAIPSAQVVRRGAGVAWLSRRSWPVAPHEPARARPHLRRAQVEPLADGTGLTFVVNSAAGSPLSGDGVSLVEKAFPAATVEAVEEGDDLGAVLSDLRETGGMRALGIAGGDGSIRAAVEAALRLDVPLVVIPAGTLNHFARDLGLATVADAVDAVASGQIVEVDVGQIDGRLFLNAAALGAYPDLIDAREQLESRIGKWPAVAVALVRVLRREAPADIELDGQPRRVWMVFVGNCRYHPSGFAPGWRERLDDGQLDIRIVDATRPWARTRLLLAVLSGRLGRSQVYDQYRAPELSIRCLDGPMRLAIDGEAVSGTAEVVVRKHPRSLRVYVPSE